MVASGPTSDSGHSSKIKSSTLSNKNNRKRRDLHRMLQRLRGEAAALLIQVDSALALARGRASDDASDASAARSESDESESRPEMSNEELYALLIAQDDDDRPSASGDDDDDRPSASGDDDRDASDASDESVSRSECDTDELRAFLCERDIARLNDEARAQASDASGESDARDESVSRSECGTDELRAFLRERDADADRALAFTANGARVLENPSGEGGC